MQLVGKGYPTIVMQQDLLPENVILYVRRALENYREGRWFDSFGWV